MKVYACYDNKDYEYRWNTILKFGKSWDVIGTVIMKNPGSAKPEMKVNDSLSEILTKKFDGHEQVRGTWYHFSPDITMRCIERLFKKYYESDNLNGVIRVFNLCNVINANYKGLLVELKKCEVDSSLAYTTDFDVENITAPTYIGWGQAWKKDFKERCKPYFKKACEEEYTILDDDIKSNPFYHPLYLMNYGGPKTKCIVDKFVKKRLEI